MWSLDGRRVYFTMIPGFELWSLAIGATATEPTRVENPGKFAFFEDATRDGRYLVFTTIAELPTIWIQRVGVPAERRQLVMGPYASSRPRVSPDGRWLAYTLLLPGARKYLCNPSTGRARVFRSPGHGASARCGAATAASCTTRARTG